MAMTHYRHMHIDLYQRNSLDLAYTSPNAVLSDALESEDGVPEWLQITPNRGKFEGRDGRRFNIKSPRAIVRAFNATGDDIQLDIDHGSEMGMFGTGTGAVGWITEMQTRHGGQIWAKVEWTGDGDKLVRNRTFRGLSPVFRITPESGEAFHKNPDKNSMDVVSITSVALTNRPNLRLKSLNTRGQPDTKGKLSMDLEKLLSALGLNAEVTEADVLTAINALKSPPAVDLDKFVPRADFDQLNATVTTMKAAETAQKELAEADAVKQHNTARDTAITAALKAGKIAPSSEEFYVETCSDAAGLARFEKLMGTTVPIVAPNAEQAPNDGKESDAPTADDAAAANTSGLTVTQIKDARVTLRASNEID